MLTKCGQQKILLRFSRSLNLTKSQSSGVSDVAVKESKISEVVVPPRIHRGPTDILKALASTVGKDYTAPHYKYHDDPYLIPMSVLNKRSYALSKESGKKAAKYFLANYPHLFYRDDAEPKIPAFSYKDMYDENTEVDLDDLEGCIDRRELANSIIVYQNLVNQKIDIPSDVQQKLLELSCFYNNTEPEDEDLVEEKWLSHPKLEEQRVGLNWQTSGFAESLFYSMEVQDSAAYCAIIQGMAKYNSSGKAFTFYEELKSKNLVCSVETFNALIESAQSRHQAGSLRWEAILGLLEDMKMMKIRPNLNTFNAMLFVLNVSGSWNQRRPLASQIMAEMSKMGIEPSLATYNYLMSIYASSDPSLLTEIVQKLENRELTIRHPKDVDFFCNAMDECSNRLNNIDLAHRIHNLLQLGNNQKLIGNPLKESQYYRYFIELHCMCETADVLMDLYNKYVPNIYIPDSFLMCRILDALKIQEAYSYLPQLWSDMIHFGVAGVPNIITNILDVLEQAETDDDQLKKQFAAIAWYIVQRAKTEKEKAADSFRAMETVGLTANDFDRCLQVLTKGEELDKATFVINWLLRERDTIVGYVSSNTMIELLNLAGKDNHKPCILSVVKYAKNLDFEDVLIHAVENADKWNLSTQLKDTLGAPAPQ